MFSKSFLCCFYIIYGLPAGSGASFFFVDISKKEIVGSIIGVQGPASRFDGAAMQAAVEPLLEQTARVSEPLGWNGLVTEVQGT